MREALFSVLKKKIHMDLKTARDRLATPIKESEIHANFLLLLKHARTNSPYYRQHIQEVTSEIQLEKLPLLGKEDINKHRDSILSSDSCDRAFAIKNSTSGSSGQATYFYSDIRDRRTARAYRGDEFVPGYHFLDRQLIFWGAERDIESRFSVKRLVHQFLYQKKIVSTYHMTEQDIDRYINLINRYKPKIIAGYPSSLTFVARYIEKNSVKLEHRPIGLITSGEMLYAHQRAIIEKAFSSRIFDRYGCREFGHIANECSAHDGYHYNADDLIIEIVDEHGIPCKNGKEGKILVTDLNNYVFPMIRYDIGDRGALQVDGPPCSCGSTLPKLKSIGGRSFDVVHGINGNRVSGTFWTLTFRNAVEGIDSFQIRQSKDFTIFLRIQVNSLYSPSSEPFIRDLIKKKLGDTKVVFSVVDKMEYSPTGKFKWIHSEINGR